MRHSGDLVASKTPSSFTAGHFYIMSSGTYNSVLMGRDMFRAEGTSGSGSLDRLRVRNKWEFARTVFGICTPLRVRATDMSCGGLYGRAWAELGY